MAIKAIIFDLWGTLGEKQESLSESFRKEFGIKKTKNYLQKYEKSIQLKKYPSKDALARALFLEFNILSNKENINQFIQKLEYGIKTAKKYPGVKTLLKKLKKNYKMGIISNTTFPESEVLDMWDIHHLFDEEVLSWQSGSIKPLQKNYSLMVKKLGCKDNECLFIDDNRDNITAAKKRGMETIHFKDIELLKKELIKMDLLKP